VACIDSGGCSSPLFFLIGQGNLSGAPRKPCVLGAVLHGTREAKFDACHQSPHTAATHPRTSGLHSQRHRGFQTQQSRAQAPCGVPWWKRLSGSSGPNCSSASAMRRSHEGSTVFPSPVTHTWWVTCLMSVVESEHILHL
jgi:hypothetical protein